MTHHPDHSKVSIIKRLNRIEGQTEKELESLRRAVKQYSKMI